MYLMYIGKVWPDYGGRNNRAFPSVKFVLFFINTIKERHMLH